MSYTVNYLQLGEIDPTEEISCVLVPGYGPFKVAVDSENIPLWFYLDNNDPNNSKRWRLQFVSCNGNLYPTSSITDKTIPLKDGDILNGWYTLDVPTRPHFVFFPFILQDNKEGFFKPIDQFVDFVPPNPANTPLIYTDIISGPVQATVHPELPSATPMKIFVTFSGNWHGRMTTITSKLVLDHIYLVGTGSIMGNQVTVNKNDREIAIVVYKVQTSSSHIDFDVPPLPAQKPGPYIIIHNPIEIAIDVRKRAVEKSL